MKKILAVVGLLATAAGVSLAGSVNVPLVNDPGMAVQKSYTANLNVSTAPFNRVAAQVIYSTVTMPTVTFTDGRTSTGSITVAAVATILSQAATNQITVPATSAILGSPATAQFTVIASTGLGNGSAGKLIVVSNTGITGTQLTINGSSTRILINGIDWATGASSAATATNIAAAINTWSGTTGIISSAPAATPGVVFATATAMGTPTNGYTILSSTPTSVSTASFSGAVNPVVLTVRGFTLVNGQDWFAAPTTSMTAVSIASAISKVSGLIANQDGTGSVVFASATVNGTAGNSFTLGTSSPVYISTSASTFSGGLTPALRDAIITFNGVNYPVGYQWTDAGLTSTGTAVSIAKLVASFSVVQATAAASVVYATATVAGTAANSFTLTASTGSGVAGLTVAKPTFTGGRDLGNLTINGTVLTQGTDFTFTASTTTTQAATALAAAINANTTLNKIIVAQGLGTVVTTTSSIVGAATAYPWSTNTIGLTLSSASSMTGGVDASYTVNTSTLTVANENLTLGVGVLYSTASGVALGGLVPNTTYYIIPVPSVSTNSFALASSTANALSGTMIVLTSSRTLTAKDNFTLAPIAFSQGSAGGTWQVSNDGTNFTPFTTTVNNVAIPSNAFNAVNPSTSTAVDFGQVDYQYLRYTTTQPTWGAVNLKVNLNGSN